MYIPKANLEEEWEQAEFLIKNYPLATVITSTEEEGIIGNHFPFFLKIDKETGKKYLHAHIARVNHQIPSLKAADKVLVIFQSTNSYITPNYYPTKQETHKFVPTWDFASTHIYGKAEVLDDSTFIRQQIDDLTNQQEAGKEDAWKVSDAPENYLKLKQKAIVGLRIEILTTHTKFKFEQGSNRKEVDGVIEGLAKDNLHEMSELTKSANERYDVKKAALKAASS
ncbi:negative transcriptional regulator [Scheffersomyces xylosifermentans]|uniref:negative transcriptional regulator n=1 Tax=Scheffersomyces xylosifermentans TaxID=1304137 RepID=UPI00315DC45A